MLYLQRMNQVTKKETSHMVRIVKVTQSAFFTAKKLLNQFIQKIHCFEVITFDFIFDTLIMHRKCNSFGQKISGQVVN